MTVYLSKAKQTQITLNFFLFFFVLIFFYFCRRISILCLCHVFMEENPYTLVIKNVRMLSEEIFDKLYVDYYPAMLAYAQNFVSPDDAEYIVQDVMVWLWDHRKKVVFKTSLKSYLFRSVRNSCMTLITQGQAQQRLKQAIFDKIQPFYEITDNYTIELLGKKIQKALSHLPEDYRTTFQKNRFEDKSYSEIATELGISIKTVEYRMTQTLKQLRVELKEFLPIAALMMLLNITTILYSSFFIFRFSFFSL